MPLPRSLRKAELLAIAALALAGCNSKPPDLSGGHEPNGPLATDNQASAPATAAATGEAGELPPPSAAPRFVGKWAADQKSCTSAAWQFTASALHTPDGGSCSFDQVSEVPGGYDVQATCTSKEKSAPDAIEIRFAESAKAMLFNSKSLGDKGLVFCGRDA